MSRDCERYDLQVGDQIRYIGDKNGNIQNEDFEYGEVLTLSRQGLTTYCPWFKGETGGEHPFDLSYRIWEKVDMKERLERNKEYDLKLTGEQIAFIHLLVGKTYGGWTSKSNLFSICENLLKTNDIPDSYSKRGDIDLQDLWGSKEVVSDWLDLIFPVENDKAIKEIEHSIKEHEKTLQELKDKIKQLK